jgi:glycosyltransferase involved in cell wall biosynthesis
MIDSKISVGLLSMNEEDSIQIVIESIRKAAPEAEIVIVDSSRDKTPEIATQLGARVIRQFPPIGYGPAMMKLLRECSRDVVITMDCDNTYPADMIPQLAKLVIDGHYDLVDASRLKTKPDAMPWTNYLANRFFAVLASILFQNHFQDLHSGMRAYRKTMIDAMDFHEKGAALPVELLIKPLLHHYKLHTISIPYQERIGESKMQPLDTVWWTFKRIFKLRFLQA